MQVYILEGRYLAQSTYLLVDGKRSILIDAGADCHSVEALCSTLGIELKYVLLTHCHFDHAISAKALQDVGKSIYCHKADAELMTNKLNLSISMGVSFPKCIPDGYVEEGKLSLDGFDLEVIHTKGHTKGGVCYLFGDILFSGDTLFRGSYGRYDFPGGNFEEIKESLSRLFMLSPLTRVYTGHGDMSQYRAVGKMGNGQWYYSCDGDTTIGYEMRNNAILYE